MSAAAFTPALAELANELQALGGRARAFAFSPDALDHVWPESIRRHAVALAKAVSTEADEAIEAVARELDAICAGDEWARDEVAKRFRGAVARLQVLAQARRHARAAKFRSLFSAIESGRFTREQRALVGRLADEARAAKAVA